MATSLAELYPRAFVTGASAGLGRAFAEMLLDEGVHVCGTARDVARLSDLAARAPGRFSAVALDLADAAGTQAAFEQAVAAVGGEFDLVVNNAGYGVFGNFAAMEFAVWQTQLEAMVTTTLRLAHRALRGMRTLPRGCLVNVSSIAAEFPLPFMTGYNVAKAALAACSQSLIIETKGTPIRVIDFRPGDFRTSFNQTMQSVSPVSAPNDPRLTAAWHALETHLQAGPTPDRAARDLKRALRRGDRGTVRSGSFFQARLAPTFSPLIPGALRRFLAARYYGL